MRDEVLVERLTSPSTARLGEKVQVSADITSTVAQPATARLFVNGELAGTQPVDLEAGANRVEFLFTAKEAGFLRFRIVVEAARDTFNQNDRADANTIVKGEPRVLVVKGDEDVAAQLVAALETERQTVDTVIPEALPADLAGLADYDSVVLVDVPRLRLTDAALAALQVYVRDLGRGLVVVGGPRAYGAGGYTDTPLEEALPVDMGVRDRQKQPDVALVVVIDKSGLHGRLPLQQLRRRHGRRDRHRGRQEGRHRQGGDPACGLRADRARRARRGGLRRAGALGRQDRAAGRHRGPPGRDRRGSRRWARRTSSPAWTRRWSRSKGATATRRHIILLTDGWSSSGQYDEILGRMKAAGITLSTVGAGGGANEERFLEQLAANGGGRYYAATKRRPPSRTSSSRRPSRSPGSRSWRRSSSRS